MTSRIMDPDVAMNTEAHSLPKKKRNLPGNNIANNIGNAQHKFDNTDIAEGNEQQEAAVRMPTKKVKNKRNAKLIGGLPVAGMTLEESPQLSSVPPPDRRYLPHETFRQQFWLLSNSSTTNPLTIEPAITSILQHVRNEYKKLSPPPASNSPHAPQKNTFVEDLHYTLMRLIAGLASPRSSGVFAAALTLFLAEPYAGDVPLDYLLEVINHTLAATTEKLTDDEIKHAHDGLLLAYSVLCNTTWDSKLWQKAGTSQILAVLRKLRELGEIKASYRTMTDQLLASTVVRLMDGSSNRSSRDLLRQCYPDEYETLQSNAVRMDQLNDRMLFVAAVAAKCGDTQMLDRIVSNAAKFDGWREIANLLRVGWLEESQPLQVERLTMPSCLIMEYLIEQNNNEFFSHFWTALCDTSLHQDGRVTGKTRFTFLLASFLLKCVNPGAEHKMELELDAVNDRISQSVQIVLSDAFVDLCVKCIKLDHSSAGKSGALVRLCETADEFMKDLIQFLRTLRNSNLTYELLVNWFERTWRTLTKADEAGVLVPLVTGLTWPHIVQFSDLLVNKFESVEKKSRKYQQRQPQHTSGATSSDDEGSANQQSVSLVLRQRLLYLIGLLLTSQVNKQPTITSAEWALCQKPFSLLTRLMCSPESTEKPETDDEASSLRTVARRELLSILHRLNESHYRNKLFPPYAGARLVLLKAIHSAVAAQPLQLSEPDETRRMELESIIKKLNKKLRSFNPQNAVGDTKVACLTFALMLTEKAYCDWQFVPLQSQAVNDVLEGCRNILHNVDKTTNIDGVNSELNGDVGQSTGAAEADCVDVAVDLILSLLLASKKEQDFLRICFASLAPVLADRHIQKLLDASLDSFAMPADDEDDEAEEDDDDDGDDEENDDDDEEDNGEDNEHENAAEHGNESSQPSSHGSKHAAKRKRNIPNGSADAAADGHTDDESEPALSDTEMLALDDQLANTFRMRIAEKKRREQQQAFPQNVLQLLLDAATNTSTTVEQHCLLITALIEVIAQPSLVANMPDKQAQWRKYVGQAALILGAFQQRRGDDVSGVIKDAENDKIAKDAGENFSAEKLAVTASEACARLIFLRDSAHLTHGMNAVFYMLRILHRSAGDANVERDEEGSAGNAGMKNRTATKPTEKQTSLMRKFYKNFLEFIGVQKTSNASSSATTDSSSNSSSVNSADFLLQRVSGWISQNGYGNSVVLPTLADQAFGRIKTDENGGADVQLTDYRRTQFIQLLSTLTNLAIAAGASTKQQQHTTNDSDWMRDFTAIAESYAVFLSRVVADSNSPTTTVGFVRKRWFSTALQGLDQILRKLMAVSTPRTNQQQDTAGNSKTTLAAKSLSTWTQSTGEMLRSLCEALNMMQKAAAAAAAADAAATLPSSSLSPPQSVADEAEQSHAQPSDVDMETTTPKKLKNNNKQKKNQNETNHNTTAKQPAAALATEKDNGKPSVNTTTIPKQIRPLIRRLTDDVKKLLAE